MYNSRYIGQSKGDLIIKTHMNVENTNNYPTYTYKKKKKKTTTKKEKKKALLEIMFENEWRQIDQTDEEFIKTNLLIATVRPLHLPL